MNADFRISRRAFAGGLVLLGLRRPAMAQGFAGLGASAAGFAPVVPGKIFRFPPITAHIRISASNGGT